MTVELRLDEHGPFTIAALSGDFGAADAPSFLETLHDAVSGAGAALAIDLAGLTAIDSTGLSALINLVARARLTQGRVVLVAPPPFVTGIFNATHLDRWFEICERLDLAEQSFTAK
jgi:anti-anti-sigma factor